MERFQKCPLYLNFHLRELVTLPLTMSFLFTKKKRTASLKKKSLLTLLSTTTWHNSFISFGQSENVHPFWLKEHKRGTSGVKMKDKASTF